MRKVDLLGVVAFANRLDYSVVADAGATSGILFLLGRIPAIGSVG